MDQGLAAEFGAAVGVIGSAMTGALTWAITHSSFPSLAWGFTELRPEPVSRIAINSSPADREGAVYRRSEHGKQLRPGACRQQRPRRCRTPADGTGEAPSRALLQPSTPRSFARQAGTEEGPAGPPAGPLTAHRAAMTPLGCLHGARIADMYSNACAGLPQPAKKVAGWRAVRVTSRAPECVSTPTASSDFRRGVTAWSIRRHLFAAEN
ncbi:hypothetical protein GCM10010254_71320 [Streptomyces chromofuscus]|nr:hypothetical protein GCM10010254_71320 [Streptomyces chromofuscus]